jgi:small multidrug resistance pump
MIFCLASSCQELSNEPVAFSFRCNYQRSCGDIGLESEQRFHAAMAVTSSNSGLRHCFFLLVADLAHDAGGIAYAIWSGIGIVLVTFIAWFVFGQSLDTPAIIGLTLIITGVVVLQIFSKSAAH